jgi:cobalt-zinc-cadmium efflux system membrane fusion protein
VRAPINGVVVDNKLAVGQAVNTDSVLVRVADLSALIAVVNVPEAHINALRLGMSAQIKAQQSQTVAQGKVSYLGAVLGEDTRSAPAFISLNNPSQQWRAGQLVQVDIVQKPSPYRWRFVKMPYKRLEIGKWCLCVLVSSLKSDH